VTRAAKGTSPKKIARAFALLTLALACAPTDPTQLVVVVDSDLASDAFDAVEVSVLGLEGGEQIARANLADGALPRYVVLERRGGALGPLDVEARAMRDGAPIGIARKARTSFVRERTMRLDLFLAAACVGQTCDATQTCERGDCVSPDVAPEQLVPWTGLDGTNDAGMPNDGDVDAGDVDASDVDAGDVDAGPCTCLSPLPPDTVGTRCESGRCVYECAPGVGNCDGRIDAVNGCEQSLDTREHCGACDAPCPEPTAFEVRRECTASGCVIECAALRDDCNDDARDGCETDLTQNGNCGMCGKTCEGPGNACEATGRCRR
jgi:hypothetical protein